MTGPEFQVAPAQIRAHADSVGQAANGLSASVSGSVELPEDALGPFVQFVTAGLGTAMTQALDAITQAASTVGDVSSALASTADDYEQADEENAALLRGKDQR